MNWYERIKLIRVFEKENVCEFVFKHQRGGDYLPFTISQIVRWIYAFTHLVVAEPAPLLTKNRIHERNIFNFNNNL